MLWTGFLFGLLGSFHCVGMCGPIALSLPSSSNQGSFLAGRVAYNLGRIFTYTTIGLLLGIFGQGLQIAGLQQTLSILSGCLILLFLFFPTKTSSPISKVLGVSKIVFKVKQLLSSFLKRKSLTSLFTIGVLNGLLPCGFVYLALIAAISSSTVIDSGIYMLLFGLGTVPLMLFLSVTGKLISAPFKNKIQKGIPYIACFVAILFILRGLSLNIPYLSPDLTQKGQKEIKCH